MADSHGLGARIQKSLFHMIDESPIIFRRTCIASIMNQIKVGDLVSKLDGDYRFHGTIACIFNKRSGATRIVVENDDGMLFIFNPSQLTKT